MNTVMSLIIALPAAYAFSRYHFRLKAPLFLAAHQSHGPRQRSFLLPFFQLYQNIGLYDTHLAVALQTSICSLMCL
ncbi:MAG: hypothetical protein R2865_11280 [Deinococcales bacterium]